MIILWEPKLCFIKNRRTAGTSIECYLSQYLTWEDVATPLHPSQEQHRSQRSRNFRDRRDGTIRFTEHMGAMDVMHDIGTYTWKGLKKFCVERNPWDKTLSRYWLGVKLGGFDLPFNEWVCHPQADLPTDWDRYTYQGHTICTVLRYEGLPNALYTYLHDRPHAPLLPGPKGGLQRLFSMNTSGVPFQEFYNERARDWVASVFHREINCFGYKFDDPDPKMGVQIPMGPPAEEPPPDPR